MFLSVFGEAPRCAGAMFDVVNAEKDFSYAVRSLQKGSAPALWRCLQFRLGGESEGIEKAGVSAEYDGVAGRVQIGCTRGW